MTSNTDITFLTLAEVSARIHAREVSCEEVTRALLERIDRLEPKVNGYVLVHREHAMAQARAADALLGAGVDHGPLHGVPIAIKDLYAERGTPSSAGSSILADWRPDEDSTAVHKLRQAGAIIIGRANMDEFAFGGTTENTHYGVTHNPWDLGTELRRLIGRLRRSGGGATGLRRAGHGHRRIHPQPVALQRCHRHQAVVWPRQQVRRRAVGVDARPRGPARPQRGGRRPGAERNRGA